MKRKTTETIIWLFCILVIVTLIVKIEVESKQYNCSNCTVKLFNTFAYGDSYKFGEYQIKRIVRILCKYR